MKVDIYDDGIGKVEYVDHMGTDLTVVNAARVSFNKEKEEMDSRDEKLVDYLVRSGHTSTLEHNVATFRFKVPLFVRSQHQRHRTWSYNEVSRRYTDEQLQFYEPQTFRTQHTSDRQASDLESRITPGFDFKFERRSARGHVHRFHQDALVLYNLLLDNGVAREMARGILPQNLYTEYYGTANLNNIMKFVKLRTDPHAQWEIQQVGNAVLDISETLWPVAVGKWREHFMENKE